MSVKITKNELKDLTKEEFCDRIIKYIGELYNLSIREQHEKSSYELASWPLFQADQIGFQRALTKIKEFLPFDQKEN